MQFYQLLGVKPGATVDEIKKVYRKLVKRFHPDSGNSSSSEDFIKLKEAYDFLIKNIEIKSSEIPEDDEIIRNARKPNPSESFDYEKFLKQFDDDESQIKLIFFYLRTNRDKEAIECFKNLNLAHKKITFKSEITREDFMDYGLILCEKLFESSEYYDCYVLADYLMRMNYKSNYFKLIMVEFRDLSRKILRHYLDKKIPDELALDCWERAVNLDVFSDSDKQYFTNKIKAVYQRIEKQWKKAS